jgi:predicted nucleic acid-binding protein
MIVDASVAAHWFADTEFSAVAGLYRKRADLIGPSFLLIETANVLYKQSRAGRIPPELCAEGINDLGLLLAEIVPDQQLLDHAMRLALEWRHPVYDCLYAALGLERREPIVTADRKLALLAEKIGVGVELIEPET